MFRAVHIATFELKRYLTNRGELAFSIALPIALFALMYGAFGGETSFSATVNVVDLDGGPHARALIDRLDHFDGLSVRERDIEDADEALDRSAVLLVLVIPNGFTSALESDESPRLIFKQRGNGGETGQIVAAIVRDVADEIAGRLRISRTVASAIGTIDVDAATVDIAMNNAVTNALNEPPIDVIVSGIDAEDADILDRLIPGLLVMFVLFAVTLGSQTLVEERRGKTLERLMTTRLGINQLFIGKYLAGVSRATSQAIILLTLAFVVLQIGNLAEFLQLTAISVLVASAVTAIGLLIGSVARTSDQAIWTAVFFTMFMTVFGGTFFDVGSEGVLYLLSKITINHYAIEAMSQILSTGAQITDQLVGISVMLGVTVVGLVIARILFKVT